MSKKIFFIILTLFLNSFDTAKSEEFLNNSSLAPKNEFQKSASDDDFSEIILPQDAPLAKEFEVLAGKGGLDLFNEDKTLLAAAGTKVTLGIFSPLLTKSEKGGIWARPYSAFEKIPLKNGPTVKSVSYGSLIGIDSDAKNLKNKWQVVHSGYLGYTGSEQSQDSIVQMQMSGFGGAYSTFYRNNFFSAIVLTAGANVIKSNDSEDITGINAGIITRTGYNIKLPHNIVVQPNYIMSYTFDKNFDYKNNKQESVHEEPLGIFHIIPSIRASLNLKNGWQPFLVTNMVFNIVQNGEVSVNNVALPSVSINPFIEYGGGIQKIGKEKNSAFIQALARSGGRNGVTILAGYKWTFN